MLPLLDDEDPVLPRELRWDPEGVLSSSPTRSPARGWYCLLSMLFFLPSPPSTIAPAGLKDDRRLFLLASHDGERSRPAASPEADSSAFSGSGCVWDFRKARNSPGASSGCRCAGTQNSDPSSSPSGVASVTSSFEVRVGEVCTGEGGGRSGSTGRAPGPGVDTDRRRRFLRESARLKPHAVVRRAGQPAAGVQLGGARRITLT